MVALAQLATTTIDIIPPDAQATSEAAGMAPTTTPLRAGPPGMRMIGVALADAKMIMVGGVVEEAVVEAIAPHTMIVGEGTTDGDEVAVVVAMALVAVVGEAVAAAGVVAAVGSHHLSEGVLLLRTVYPSQSATAKRQDGICTLLDTKTILPCKPNRPVRSFHV